MKRIKLFEEFEMEQMVSPKTNYNTYEDKFSKLMRFDSDWLNNGWMSSEEKLNFENSVNKSEFIRSLWNKKADHNFFDSIVKIHWVKSEEGLKQLLSIPKESVLCCNGYYENEKIEGETWSNIGVILDGDVVFASNNDLESGWGNMKKLINNTKGKSISLNKDTFLSNQEISNKTNKSVSRQAGNEILITNFKIKEIVVREDNEQVKELAVSNNIPFRKI
jgi:hypothetical protein